jgi:predicted PurR-regulated permease PerM
MLPGINKDAAISITSGTIIRVILFGILLWLLYYLRDIVAVVLASVVIASAVEPAARWFEKRRIPRILGVIFVYVFAFVIIGAIFYFIVPPVFSDLSGLTEAIPKYLERPFKSATLPSFFSSLPESISIALSDLADVIQKNTGEIATGFFQAASLIFGGAMSFVLVIVISFYLSVEKNGVEKFLRVVTPIVHEDYALSLWRRTQQKIGWWLQGQILLGVMVGVLVYLGLTILGVKYALVFAMLAAIFELIPMFGAVLASIPAIGMAFLDSVSLGLATLVLYVIIQQFENHLIYPVVVKKIVGIPPLVVILALIVGAKLAGFFGILLAVPVAAAFIEFANDIAEEKHIFNKKTGVA